MPGDSACHLPASRPWPIEAARGEASPPVADWNLTVEACARPVQPSRGDYERSWDDAPPRELGAPFRSPWRPIGAQGGQDSLRRDSDPQGAIAVPAVQVVDEVAGDVHLRGRRRMRDGRVTGQLAGAARLAGELAADGLVLGVAVDGAPAVQLAAIIAVAAATS